MSDIVVKRPFPVPVVNRRWALHLGGIAALALVLATSGAFGSDDLPIVRRLIMFGIIAGLLITQASALADLARRFHGLSWARSVCAVLFALAGTLLLMTIEVHLLKSTPIVPYRPDPLPGFALFLAPFVLPVGALVLALRWSAFASRDPHPSRVVKRTALPGPAEIAPPAPDANEDWPSGPILRVRAADHYLELWTSRGVFLVRGRMRDALCRLPSSEGLQPHRSWWVAFSEVDRLDRRGRDLVLLMENGDRLPVARSRAAEIRRVLDRSSRIAARLQGDDENSAVSP